MTGSVRNTDPETSEGAAGEMSDRTIAKLYDLIAELLWHEKKGLIGNELARLIPEHTHNSITPRLHKMVELGLASRVQLGVSKRGRSIFLQRADSEPPYKPGIVNYHPRHVPKPEDLPAPAQRELPLVKMMKKPSRSVKASKKEGAIR